MAAQRIRLCQYDRDRFGGPEWLTWDKDALLELPFSDLSVFERVTGQRIVDIVSDYGVARLKARYWIARRLAGLVEDYDTLDLRVLAAEVEDLPEAAPDPKEDPIGPEPSSNSSSPAAA